MVYLYALIQYERAVTGVCELRGPLQCPLKATLAKNLFPRAVSKPEGGFLTVRLIVLGILCAAALTAAGVAGKWRGTITTEMARDTTGGEIPAYLALEQSDGKVTGSAGGNENMLFPIREGRFEGDRLTIEASPKQGSVLRFILKLNADVLAGDVEENGRTIGAAKLKRER